MRQTHQNRCCRWRRCRRPQTWPGMAQHMGKQTSAEAPARTRERQEQSRRVHSGVPMTVCVRAVLRGRRRRCRATAPPYLDVFVRRVAARRSRGLGEFAVSRVHQDGRRKPRSKACTARHTRHARLVKRGRATRRMTTSPRLVSKHAQAESVATAPTLLVQYVWEMLPLSFSSKMLKAARYWSCSAAGKSMCQQSVQSQSDRIARQSSVIGACWRSAIEHRCADGNRSASAGNNGNATRDAQAPN